MKWIMAILAVLLLGLAYSGVKTAMFSFEQSNRVDSVQTLKRERDKINAEWTQLLLEQKMLADDAVITRAVRQGLDMQLPQAGQVVYLD